MLSDLKGKKLLLLSGNAGTIDLIERCHEFGIIVYVTDYLKDSPGKKYADKSFMISTNDVDAVVDLCKSEEIDGVLTVNIDFLLPYYCKICSKYNVPCYGSLESFIETIDKKKFKNTCKKYGVPTTNEYSYEELKNNQKLFPVIVKPVDSSSSRGITVCDNVEQLDLAIDYALVFSKSKEYIIEKYMTGQEVVAYYYFQDNNPVFIGMCDRYTGKSSNKQSKVPTAYIFPSKSTKAHIENSDQKYKHMFKEMGMQNGPIFLQCFMDNSTTYVYEPGYRLNGAREHYIYGYELGLNSADMLVNFSLTGKMADFNLEDKADPYLHGKFGCKLSPILGLGKVAKIEGLDKVRKIPEVIKVLPVNDVGSEVTEEKIGTLPSLAYRAYIICDTVDGLKKVIDTIQNTIKYYDENDNELSIEKFDTSLLEIYKHQD